jgi:hypothetical protein
MNAENEVHRAISNLAGACGLEGPSSVLVKQGTDYGSGHNERDGYYFTDSGGKRYIRGQDAIEHEAAHLVRLYIEKELGIGLRQ